MTLGFYLSLDPPGYTSVSQAIVSAVLPKQRWLKKFSIPDDWPCWGLPETLHSDNAREFRSKWLERISEKYKLGLMFRPAGRPNFGGHIERLLGVSLHNIHSLPGASFSNPRHRAGYDSEGLAAFTLPELEEWFGLWITGIYHNSYHSGIGSTPLQKYREGILGTDEHPGRGYPVRIEDEETFRIEMLPSVERTIQREGVEIDGILYRSDDLRPLVGLRKAGRGGQKPKYRFHRDPRDISRIYFFSPVGKRFVAIPYRNIGHPPISVWELRAAKRTLRDEGKKHVDEKAIFRAYGRMLKLEEDSVSKTRKARRKRAARDHHQSAHDGLPSVPTSASVSNAGDQSFDLDFSAPVVPFDSCRVPARRTAQ
jgi:putative transposase